MFDDFWVMMALALELRLVYSLKLDWMKIKLGTVTFSVIPNMEKGKMNTVQSFRRGLVSLCEVWDINYRQTNEIRDIWGSRSNKVMLWLSSK